MHSCRESIIYSYQCQIILNRISYSTSQPILKQRFFLDSRKLKILKLEDVNIIGHLFLSLMNKQSRIKTAEDQIYDLSVSTTKCKVLYQILLFSIQILQTKIYIVLPYKETNCFPYYAGLRTSVEYS